MKTKSAMKLWSLVLSLVLVVSCMSVLAACGEEKKPDEPPAHTHSFDTAWEFDEENHWHKATCEHTTEISGKAAHTVSNGKCSVCGWEEPITVACGLPCPTCGKCMDVNCTEDTVKCGDGMKSFKFEAEEAVLKNGTGPDGNEWSLNINCEVDEGHEAIDYVQGVMGNSGASFTFKITSDKDATVTLKIYSAKNKIKSIFTEGMMVLVNGELIERASYVPAPHAGHSRKTCYGATSLGCIKLKKGENTIILTVATADSEKGYNMDKIELLTPSDVNLTWKYTNNADRASKTYDKLGTPYVTPSERKK